MTISTITDIELRQKLASQEGLGIELGPFVISVQSTVDSVINGIKRLYADYPVFEGKRFIDYRLALNPVGGIRCFIKPQVQFSFDGLQPFVPLPLNHAFPMFEWALNWCVAKHAHQYLIIHAAVVEKCGRALILPGEPGAGKSTLCAALVNRGWRLLTDELAMISLDSGNMVPLPRPVSLKNESINIMRSYAPGAVFGEVFLDTKKGTVGHMKPSADSVARINEFPQPAWIVMPRYLKNSRTVLKRDSKAVCCLRLANNSFNYNILDVDGFEALSRLVDRCDCYSFCYSDLDSAIEVFDSLEPPHVS